MPMPRLSHIVIATVVVYLAGTAGAWACSYPSPTGVTNLGLIPTATLQIDQTYMNQNTSYWWVISLCGAWNQPPPGRSTCAAGPGYVSEYSSTTCETAFNNQIVGWHYDDSTGMGTAKFDNSKGWELEVELGCGTTLELQAAGTVHVSTSLTFAMSLTTSAVCGPSGTPVPYTPLPPTPLPPPPACHDCDIGGTTVSQLPAVIMNFDERGKGGHDQPTPMQWVIDLCRQTPVTPPGASVCQNKNLGYITEYTPSEFAKCWSVYDANTGFLFTNGTWMGNYTSTLSGWTMTVIGHCGPNAELKNVGDAIITQLKGPVAGYHYTITFVSKAFCPVDVTPAPLTPAPEFPPAPVTNGTVTRLMCKESGCRQCTGDVLPIGSCVSAGVNSTASEKAMSCSSAVVVMDSWPESSACSAPFYPTQTSWPVGKCIAVGPNDFRFYSCSP